MVDQKDMPGVWPLGLLQGAFQKEARARLYWGNIGIMEKKMETTIMGYIGFI